MIIFQDPGTAELDFNGLNFLAKFDLFIPTLNLSRFWI